MVGKFDNGCRVTYTKRDYWLRGYRVIHGTRCNRLGQKYQQQSHAFYRCCINTMASVARHSITENSAQYMSALRGGLKSDNLRTLGFLFLDPFGLPRGRFITGAPSSWGFCGEKVNKHWWSILSWAKFSPQAMTSYSCMWPSVLTLRRREQWNLSVTSNIHNTHTCTSGKFFLGRPLFPFLGTSVDKSFSSRASSFTVSCVVSVAAFGALSSCGATVLVSLIVRTVRAPENYFQYRARDA